MPSSSFPVELHRVSKVVLLTHPLEIKQQALRTGRMVEVAFGDAVRVFVGRDFRGESELHEILDSSEECLLLALRDGSDPLRKVVLEGKARANGGEEDGRGKAPSASPETGRVLVLLDATWRFAGDMLKKNAFLLEKCRCVYLDGVGEAAAAFASCRVPPKRMQERGGGKGGKDCGADSGASSGGSSESSGEGRPVSTFGAAVEAMIILEGEKLLWDRLGLRGGGGGGGGGGEGKGDGEGDRGRKGGDRTGEKEKELDDAREAKSGDDLGKAARVARLREVLLAPLALVAEQQRGFRLAAEERKRARLKAAAPARQEKEKDTC